VTLQSFEKASHLGLLKDDRTIQVILHLLDLHSGGPGRSGGWLGRAWELVRGVGGTPRDLLSARRQLTERRDAYTLRHPHTGPLWESGPAGFWEGVYQVHARCFLKGLG